MEKRHFTGTMETVVRVSESECQSVGVSKTCHVEKQRGRAFLFLCRQGKEQWVKVATLAITQI